MKRVRPRVARAARAPAAVRAGRDRRGAGRAGARVQPRARRPPGQRRASSVVQARASAELVIAAASPTAGSCCPTRPMSARPTPRCGSSRAPRALEQPRSAAERRRPRPSSPAARPRPPTSRRRDARLYALPVAQAGRRVGAVVAGISLAPYQQTRRTALVASLILALAVLAAVALSARWLIDRALRPVASMTRQAADWSEHDLDRRFALGPATRRAHAARQHPRRAARAAGREPAPRAAPLGRDLARAAHATRQHRRRGAVRAPSRPSRPTSPERRSSTSSRAPGSSAAHSTR